jgi:hypothetical protein
MDPKWLFSQQTITGTYSSHDSAPDPTDAATLSTVESFGIWRARDYGASAARKGEVELDAGAMSGGRFPQTDSSLPVESSSDLHLAYVGNS